MRSWTTAAAIAREAGVPVRAAGRSDLVGASDAAAFLDACERVDALVVGIEGFIVDEASLTPDMEWIADFSTVSSSAESVREARLFVAEAPRHLYFDFVVLRDARAGGSATPARTRDRLPRAE